MEKYLWARAVIQILWQRIIERRYAVQALKYVLKVYQNHTCYRREKAILVMMSFWIAFQASLSTNGMEIHTAYLSLS